MRAPAGATGPRAPTLAVLVIALLSSVNKAGGQLPGYAQDTTNTEPETAVLEDRLTGLWCKYGYQRCNSSATSHGSQGDMLVAVPSLDHQYSGTAAQGLLPAAAIEWQQRAAKAENLLANDTPDIPGNPAATAGAEQRPAVIREGLEGVASGDTKPEDQATAAGWHALKQGHKWQHGGSNVTLDLSREVEEPWKHASPASLTGSQQHGQLPAAAGRNDSAGQLARAKADASLQLQSSVASHEVSQPQGQQQQLLLLLEGERALKPAPQPEIEQSGLASAAGSPTPLSAQLPQEPSRQMAAVLSEAGVGSVVDEHPVGAVSPLHWVPGVISVSAALVMGLYGLYELWAWRVLRQQLGRAKGRAKNVPEQGLAKEAGAAGAQRDQQAPPEEGSLPGGGPNLQAGTPYAGNYEKEALSSQASYTTSVHRALPALAPDASGRSGDLQKAGWAPSAQQLTDPSSSIINPFFGTSSDGDDASWPSSPNSAATLPTGESSALGSPAFCHHGSLAAVVPVELPPCKEGSHGVGTSSSGSSPIEVFHPEEGASFYSKALDGAGLYRQESGSPTFKLQAAPLGGRSSRPAARNGPALRGSSPEESHLRQLDSMPVPKGEGPMADLQPSPPGHGGSSLLAADSVGPQVAQAVVEWGQALQSGRLLGLEGPFELPPSWQWDRGAAGPDPDQQPGEQQHGVQHHSGQQRGGREAGDSGHLVGGWGKDASEELGVTVCLVGRTQGSGSPINAVGGGLVWQRTFVLGPEQPGTAVALLPLSCESQLVWGGLGRQSQPGSSGGSQGGAAAVVAGPSYPPLLPARSSSAWDSIPMAAREHRASMGHAYPAAAVADGGTPTQVAFAVQPLVPHLPGPFGEAAASSPADEWLCSGVASLTPQQFEREVELGALLGVGGTGSVYQATWRGQQVAVKVLHPSQQLHPASLAVFRREVQVLGRIGRHPHIVSALAACLHPPHCCIIQELAGRGSLWSSIHEDKLCPQYGTLLQLAEDIASAMHHCHQLSPPVVHRDLKTHNILLGADGRARVADFGLAAFKNRTFITNNDRGALGTVAYMAPETFSHGDIDERADVFGFGVILWECLTGREPWAECSNIMQIVMAVGVERRQLPIPPDCPLPLRQLMKDCWCESAARRPSFAEVLRRLKEIREAVPGQRSASALSRTASSATEPSSRRASLPASLKRASLKQVTGKARRSSVAAPASSTAGAKWRM